MKTLVSAFAVAALAGSAFGMADTVDRSNFTIFDEANLPEYVTITKTPVDRDFDRQGTDVFDSLGSGSGYLASPAASGTLGIEDYVTSLGDGASDGVDNTGGTFNMCEFGFVGGFATGDGILFWDFFDVGLGFVDGFGVDLTSAGNFIYTITIGDPANLNIPVEGIMVMSTDVGTTGQWFLSDDVAAAGAHGNYAEDAITGDKLFDYGAGPVPINYLSRLNVPTPGAAALFGIAGLAGVRRRR